MLVGPAEAVELAGLLSRVAVTDPEAVTRLGPLGQRLVREVNALARSERQRRRDADWRAGLVPLPVAAERLGIPERTLRRHAASGKVTAERVGARWMVDPAA